MPEYTGTDTITLTVSDLGNTGSGGAKTDSKSIAVKVGNRSVVADLVAWWNFNEAQRHASGRHGAHGVDDSGTLRDNTHVEPVRCGRFAVARRQRGLGRSARHDRRQQPRDVHRTVSGWFYVADKTISSRNQVIFEEGGDQRGLNIYVSNGRPVRGWLEHPDDRKRLGRHVPEHRPDPIGTLAPRGAGLERRATVTAGALRGYLDGVEFGSGVGSQLWAHSDPTGIGQGAAYVRFHSGLSSGGNGFAGMLDDLRVYNRVLAAAEVAELASQQMSAPCQLTVTVTPDSVWENGSPISGHRDAHRRRGQRAGRDARQQRCQPIGGSRHGDDRGRAGLGHVRAHAAEQHCWPTGPRRSSCRPRPPGAAAARMPWKCGTMNRPQQTLAAYWAMDEGSGTTAADTAPKASMMPARCEATRPGRPWDWAAACS